MSGLVWHLGDHHLPHHKATATVQAEALVLGGCLQRMKTQLIIFLRAGLGVSAKQSTLGL